MAAYAGRVTGPITGKSEVITSQGFTFEATDQSLSRMRTWKRALAVDSTIGIAGNLFTTLMTCLLAYAFLFPAGIFPERYGVAVVQASFFERSWGVVGRLVFLVVAACFLSDSWMATLDGVSRIHADFFTSLLGGRFRIDYRKAYYSAAVVLTAVTAVTMPFAEPAALIELSAVIGFAGTVVLSFTLIVLNYWKLPRLVPGAATPGRAALAGLSVSAAAYLLLAAAYMLL